MGCRLQCRRAAWIIFAPQALDNMLDKGRLKNGYICEKVPNMDGWGGQIIWWIYQPLFFMTYLTIILG